MKIHITDIGWGIDRKSGVRTEKVLEKKTFVVNEGDVIESGPLKKTFKILKIEGDAVTIELREGKDMTFFRKDKFNYYPVSRDGGHYYIIKIK